MLIQDQHPVLKFCLRRELTKKCWTSLLPGLQTPEFMGCLWYRDWLFLHWIVCAHLCFDGLKKSGIAQEICKWQVTPPELSLHCSPPHSSSIVLQAFTPFFFSIHHASMLGDIGLFSQWETCPISKLKKFWVDHFCFGQIFPDPKNTRDNSCYGSGGKGFWISHILKMFVIVTFY